MHKLGEGRCKLEGLLAFVWLVWFSDRAYDIHYTIPFSCGEIARVVHFVHICYRFAWCFRDDESRFCYVCFRVGESRVSSEEKRVYGVNPPATSYRSKP